MSLPIDYVVCNWAEMNAGGERELDTSGRPQDPRRAGVRILDTAEGVLIALRGCSLNQAFVEIVQTAKAHNVNTLSLADLLVALAQNQASGTGMTRRFVAARAAWGHLFGRTRQSRGASCGREGEVVPGA
jgi:hypothetical protein